MKFRLLLLALTAINSVAAESLAQAIIAQASGAQASAAQARAAKSLQPKPAKTKASAARRPTAAAKPPAAKPPAERADAQSPAGAAAEAPAAAAKESKAAPKKEGRTKDEKKKGDLKQMLSSKEDDRSPLYVKSDSLALNAKSRVFTYSGNVEVQKGDMRITCDNMIGTYDADNRLENVLCKDNVVITRGTELKANANRANYSIKRAIIELTEGPELAREGNVLSADKILIYVDEDRSEAEGNVRVKVIKADEGAVPGSSSTRNEIVPAVQPSQPPELTVIEPSELPEQP